MSLGPTIEVLGTNNEAGEGRGGRESGNKSDTDHKNTRLQGKRLGGGEGGREEREGFLAL